MSDIKCPFCNGELVGTIGHPICRNQNCVMCDDPMPQDLLEELIRTKELLEIESSEHELCHDAMVKRTEELNRTRKALDVALDAIDKGEAALIGCQEADDKYISDVTAEDGLELMSKAYKQIKALEQGELFADIIKKIEQKDE